MFRKHTEDYDCTTYKSRAEWLKGRADGIGASEVPTVLGISPRSWGNAVDLWEKKTSGRTDEGEQNEDMRKGSEAEAHIRELFAIEHPELKVYDGTGIVFRSKKYPWLTCSLDGIVEDEDGNLWDLEIKHVRYSAHWKDGGMPRYYRYQVYSQLLVTRFKGAILLPRITYAFSSERKWHERLASSAIREEPRVVLLSSARGQFNGIVRETRAFWKSVKDGTPPPVIIGR